MPALSSELREVESGPVPNAGAWQRLAPEPLERNAEACTVTNTLLSHLPNRIRGGRHLTFFDLLRCWKHSKPVL